MLYSTLLLLGASRALAQSSSTTTTSSDSFTVIRGTTFLLGASGSITDHLATSGTPTYISYASTQSVTSSTNTRQTTTTASNSTSSDAFPTKLTGTHVLNVTATGTSTSATPTNTQPCNGWVEYCNRKYSNITQVAAHNSPFAVQNNVASNQDFGIFSQLNDGVRMLQGQTHMYNGTLRYCHTSCELLNAGTVEEYLRNATEWIQKHPFEVLTILIGNGDYATVQASDYVAPITDSGILDYLYEPPKIPMGLDDWPTLQSLILSQKRVILFMDYNANQTEIPYILDEFSQIWETPYSPTDDTFPCTQERPPDLSDKDAEGRMYMVNHNLNANISLLGSGVIQIPNTVEINNTNSNGLDTVGELGRNVDNCTTKWNRPPNFLLVDYYNRGNFNGSVFAAAAAANGVTYNADGCCGKNANVNGALAVGPSISTLLAALVVGLAWSV